MHYHLIGKFVLFCFNYFSHNYIFFYWPYNIGLMLSILNTLSCLLAHYFSGIIPILQMRIQKLRMAVTCLSSLLCNRTQDGFYRITWSRDRLYREILQADVSKRGTHSWSLSTSPLGESGPAPCWIYSGFKFQ